MAFHREGERGRRRKGRTCFDHPSYRSLVSLSRSPPTLCHSRPLRPLQYRPSALYRAPWRRRKTGEQSVSSQKFFPFHLFSPFLSFPPLFCSIAPDSRSSLLRLLLSLPPFSSSLSFGQTLPCAELARLFPSLSPLSRSPASLPPLSPASFSREGEGGENRARPAAAAMAGRGSFRYHVWDPLQIVLQMATLQAAHYAIVGAMLAATAHAVSAPLSLSLLFSERVSAAARGEGKGGGESRKRRRRGRPSGEKHGKRRHPPHVREPLATRCCDECGAPCRSTRHLLAEEEEAAAGEKTRGGGERVGCRCRTTSRTLFLWPRAATPLTRCSRATPCHAALSLHRSSRPPPSTVSSLGRPCRRRRRRRCSTPPPGPAAARHPQALDIWQIYPAFLLASLVT